MNMKKVYIAPAAEVVLLAPTEALAAWDWSFENVWKAGYDLGDPEKNIASSVGIINGGAGFGNSGWVDSGYGNMSGFGSSGSAG